MATRKRFTKALFLRLCAVGLFICLGTFAVMHSIQNQKNKETELAENAAETDEGEVARVPVTPDDDKVTTVSGIDDQSTKAASPPPFQPNRPSGSSGFSLGDNAPKSNNTTQPPPFRPSGSSNAKSSFAASSDKTVASGCI